MPKKSSKIIFYAVIVVLLIVVGVLFVKNSALSKKVALLEQQQGQLQENFRVLKASYETTQQKNTDLQTKNAHLSDESMRLTEEMDSVRHEMGDVLDSMEQFENKVEDSIEWFKQNVRLDGISEYDPMKLSLSECVTMKESCNIDLKCIQEVNEKYKFEYAEDLKSVDADDFLKDLVLIFDQKGGDCEDFSLVYRAEYNYLVDKCLENYSREQIVPIADNKKIDGTYMNIICGSFDPGLSGAGFMGHCLVGLSETPIVHSNEVYGVISGTVLVEPQTGEYVDDMATTDMIKVFNDGEAPNTLHYVWMVITDDDLKVFYEFDEEIEWKGYHEFQANIKTMKERMKQ